MTHILVNTVIVKTSHKINASHKKIKSRDTTRRKSIGLSATHIIRDEVKVSQNNKKQAGPRSDDKTKDKYQWLTNSSTTFALKSMIKINFKTN